MIRLLVKHGTEEGIHHSTPSGIVVRQKFIFLVGGTIRNDDLGIEDVLVTLKLGISTNKQEILARVREDEERVSPVGQGGQRESARRHRG